MPREETLHVHAMVLRARAAVLMHGDAEAQVIACNLETDADAIDPQPQREPAEEAV